MRTLAAGPRALAIAGALAAVTAVPALTPAVAGAATELRPCAPKSRVLCGRVSVPLDRSGRVPGRVSLNVRLVRAPGRARGTVLFVPGGPGQAAAPIAGFMADPEVSPLGPAVLRSHNLLLVDQRGTGGSALLRCPLVELSTSSDPGPEIAACAARLGPRRDFFQTRDAADDIESVRQELGLGKLSLVGISYGTKLAVSYARRHPTGVARLVLDSVVAPGGPDAFSRDSIVAVPRVLPALCTGTCRRTINPDPLGDLRALVERLRGGPLLGVAVGFDGKRRTTRLGRADLLGLIISGDLGPSIFAQLPAALRAARQEDPGPLLRLLRVVGGINAETPPEQFSVALLLANSCTEVNLPWASNTPVGAARLESARATANSLGPGAFFPFDVETAVQVGFASLCTAWPSPDRPPEDESAPLPAVPALLLNGTRDLRTSLEGARGVAAQLPRGRLVPVAEAGHSALTTDLTGCAGRVLQRFFAGAALGTCSRGRSLLPPTPLPPVALSAVAPVRGVPASIGRTACGVGLTLRDASVALLGGKPTLTGKRLSVRAPGLRSGTVTVRVVLEPGTRGVLTMAGYSYVRGLTLSGTPRFGPIRVDGTASTHGSVTLDGTRLVGRLGGRAVNVDVASCLRGSFRPVVFVPASASGLLARWQRVRLGP